ncbi:hypothetical protein B0H17DRAFT_1151323 [Mycena rosella]|uniref:Uncharacterized protein n=1 Tax=Mycena rosella TaxID=1033263 RepID=A0AAD7BLH1_MYCRO|nr:hypothetical protein B0H17DRAFT_1151323 [Mycena rosella]
MSQPLGFHLQLDCGLGINERWDTPGGAIIWCEKALKEQNGRQESVFQTAASHHRCAEAAAPDVILEEVVRVVHVNMSKETWHRGPKGCRELSFVLPSQSYNFAVLLYIQWVNSRVLHNYYALPASIATQRRDRDEKLVQTKKFLCIGMPPKPPKPSTGPPQALVECLNYLKELLVHLPEVLPLNPDTSLYRFCLDEDCVADAESVFPETGHALEISFGTWKSKEGQVRFVERGTRLQALVLFLQSAIRRMTPSEREAFEKVWVDRLIKGMKDSGAVIPSHAEKRKAWQAEESDPEEVPARKRRAQIPIVLDDNDSNTAGAGPSIQPNVHHPSVPKQTLTPGAVVPSTSDISLVQNCQATLTRMGWQPWAPRAKEAHQKEMIEAHREGRDAVIRRKEENEEIKQQRRREQAAERQRRHRAKQKAADDGELSDDNNTNVVLLRGANALAHEREIDVAGLSRVGTQGWRVQRNGTKGGAVQKKAASVNWFTLFLFGRIETAMRRTGWSPTAAVQKLQRESPMLFRGLAKGTIS